MTNDISWLTNFGAHRQDVTSPALYWVSMIALLLGFVGLLWSIPVPRAFDEISPFLNWGTAFLIATLVYYFIISVSLALGMVPFILGIAAIETWLVTLPTPVGYVASILVGISISGLCFGHYMNKGVRAVLRDVQLLMIAPIWLLSNLYKKLGIPF